MSPECCILPGATPQADLAALFLFSREGGPTIFAQVKNGKNVDHIVNLILSAWKGSGASQAAKKA